MKIAVTGAAGLLGWHACARLHARICAARFRGADAPVAMVAIDRAVFGDADRLAAALTGVDAVLPVKTPFNGTRFGSRTVATRGTPVSSRRYSMAPPVSDAATSSPLPAPSCNVLCSRINRSTPGFGVPGPPAPAQAVQTPAQALSAAALEPSPSLP